MRVQITNINIQHSVNEVTGVQISFNGLDDTYRTSLNGSVPVTVEDYEKKMTLRELSKMVRDDLVEQLMSVDYDLLPETYDAPAFPQE